jgi:hypothetical protein
MPLQDTFKSILIDMVCNLVFLSPLVMGLQLHSEEPMICRVKVCQELFFSTNHGAFRELYGKFTTF